MTAYEWLELYGPMVPIGVVLMLIITGRIVPGRVLRADQARSDELAREVDRYEELLHTEVFPAIAAASDALEAAHQRVARDIAAAAGIPPAEVRRPIPPAQVRRRRRNLGAKSVAAVAKDMGLSTTEVRDLIAKGELEAAALRRELETAEPIQPDVLVAGDVVLKRDVAQRQADEVARKADAVPQPARPTMDLLVDEATQKPLPKVRVDPALRNEVGGLGLWEPGEGWAWRAVNRVLRRWGSKRAWDRWTNHNLTRYFDR